MVDKCKRHHHHHAIVPPTHNSSASIIGINAEIVQIPPGQGPSADSSAYTSFKIAQLKVLEFLAAEHPDFFIASVHPGVVVTELAKAMTPELARQASEENGNAQFDDGKMITLQNACERDALADIHHSEITRPLHRLDDEPRSAFPTRKVRLGELGRGAAQSSSKGDPRDAGANLQCFDFDCYALYESMLDARSSIV